MAKSPTAQRLVIARNPDPDSRLPYLLRLPVGEGLVLKVRDTWPRTARVFCARADGWPPDAEIIEDVPLLLRRRRGRTWASSKVAATQHAGMLAP